MNALDSMLLLFFLSMLSCSSGIEPFEQETDSLIGARLRPFPRPTELEGETSSGTDTELEDTETSSKTSTEPEGETRSRTFTELEDTETSSRTSTEPEDTETSSRTSTELEGETSSRTSTELEDTETSSGTDTEDGGCYDPSVCPPMAFTHPSIGGAWFDCYLCDDCRHSECYGRVVILRCGRGWKPYPDYFPVEMEREGCDYVRCCD